MNQKCINNIHINKYNMILYFYQSIEKQLIMKI
jgi:hypothetical protein